jgi:hypothetical protein
MGDISEGVADTLYKNIQKNIFSLQTAEAEPQFSRRFVEAAPDSVQPPHLPPKARYASRENYREVL